MTRQHRRRRIPAIKCIAGDAHGELRGAHLVGAAVSEPARELTAAQLCELTSTELTRNVHNAPMLGERLRECFHALAGHAINP